MTTLAPPRLVDERIALDSRRLRVALRRRSASVASTLIKGVEWNCVAPAADGEIEIDGNAVRGAGYAEVLTLRVAPWRLPIEELRWGRFIGSRSSLVWIDWRGAHPLRLVARDGTIVEGRVEENRVAWSNGSLEISDRTILRDDVLRTTLAPFPLLTGVVPDRLLDASETKWRSRGALRTIGATEDHGWSIHEVVRFR